MKIDNMITHTKSSTWTQKKKSGFTLIEVIAVLVLLGILAAIAVPKYMDLTQEAESRAIDAAVGELNGRDSLAWGEQMLATSGAPDDSVVLTAVEPTSLGTDYSVVDTAAPVYAVTFGSTTVSLTRAGTATADGPASWSRP